MRTGRPHFCYKSPVSVTHLLKALTFSQNRYPALIPIDRMTVFFFVVFLSKSLTHHLFSCGAASSLLRLPKTSSTSLGLSQRK